VIQKELQRVLMDLVKLNQVKTLRLLTRVIFTRGLYELLSSGHYILLLLQHTDAGWKAI
ncbi:hypothetical protein MKX01_011532, partial [Papaver californicum]